ncbi:MAG: hypothetical protein HUU18_07650 [Phycisphaerales bacterium]|nr:hypothetical protein [Phycisphaerales bacterium]
MSHETFETECAQVVSRLKSALIELFDAGHENPQQPQDVSRSLGINKTLTWSISRLLEAPSAIEAIPFIPGAGSIAKVADAFPKSPQLIEAKLKVRQAANEYDAMIARHAGDRATLELILDNILTDEGDRLGLSRRLTFRGNSGICGVQAKARLTTWIIVPNADNPDRLDLVTIRGYVNVRRLRPSVEWPIFKVRVWDDSPSSNLERWRPVDRSSEDGVPLLREFCRGELPPIDVTDNAKGRDFVVRSGPIGNAASFDCFTAEYMRGDVPRYRSDGDDTGEVGTSITTPCEHLVFDLLYHASLKECAKSESMIFGETFAQGQRTPATHDPRELPIPTRLTEIAGKPPAVATPLIPRYADMTQRVLDEIGINPAELRGLRLELDYPPLNSQLLIRFPLETR